MLLIIRSQQHRYNPVQVDQREVRIFQAQADRVAAQLELLRHLRAVMLNHKRSTPTMVRASQVTKVPALQAVLVAEATPAIQGLRENECGLSLHERTSFQGRHW